jgi:hypothetical protein
MKEMRQRFGGDTRKQTEKKNPKQTNKNKTQNIYLERNKTLKQETVMLNEARRKTIKDVRTPRRKPGREG